MGSTIAQVVFHPDAVGVRAGQVLLGVGAVQVAGQGVVGLGLLDDDLDRGVVGPVRLSTQETQSETRGVQHPPFETKESGQEVLRGLEHAVLGLGHTLAGGQRLAGREQRDIPSCGR